MHINKARSYLLILLISAVSTANAADFEFPQQDVIKKFFENKNISLTPVYAVMKNDNDHVATVHGFVDNLEICKEFVDVLNKSEPKKLFTCVKLSDGALK